MPSSSKELLEDNLHEDSKRLTFFFSKASTDCMIILIGFHFIIFTLYLWLCIYV
jgi:hypothetical protein